VSSYSLNSNFAATTDLMGHRVATARLENEPRARNPVAPTRHRVRAHFPKVSGDFARYGVRLARAGSEAAAPRETADEHGVRRCCVRRDRARERCRPFLWHIACVVHL